MSKPKISVDCKVDQQNKKHALYIDDFENIKMWRQVCEMFDVPTDADQIYFNAKDITYGV